MITVYTGKDKSSRSAVSWFLWQNIEIKVCTKGKMKDETIRSICEEFPFKIDTMFSKRSKFFEDVAPFFESMTCQLCLPTPNARMLRSASLLSSGIIGSSRKHLRYFS